MDWNRNYSIYEIINPVAPHVGAWIETKIVFQRGFFKSVAPHVGAWIETLTRWAPFVYSLVAPHVGAWIETMENPNKKEHD